MIKFENFKKVLLDNGVASSRVDLMAEAVAKIHEALFYMDAVQRENFFEAFGGVCELADDFGKAEGLNRFKRRPHIPQDPIAWHVDPNERY